MRVYAATLPLGVPFLGAQVAKIIESKNAKFPVGKHITAQFGWRSHTVSNGTEEEQMGFPTPTLLPDFGNLPVSLAVGALGMPGNTAYFGLLEVCKPNPGETVIVTGAAGAVGSLVGQIAKIKGCKVIGVAGSAEKGKWLVDELGFDHFINYKTDDLDKVLKELAPEGIDCHFDNVGGEISATILKNMNHFGRVAISGAISGYNVSAPKVSETQLLLVHKELKMEGLIVTRWLDRWLEGILANQKWIEEGKLQYRETVYEGFENMFNAFSDMLNGGNTGKAVVKA